MSIVPDWLSLFKIKTFVEAIKGFLSSQRAMVYLVAVILFTIMIEGKKGTVENRTEKIIKQIYPSGLYKIGHFSWHFNWHFIWHFRWHSTLHLVDFGTSKLWLIRFHLEEQDLAEMTKVKFIIPTGQYKLVCESVYLTVYRLFEFYTYYT